MNFQTIKILFQYLATNPKNKKKKNKKKFKFSQLRSSKTFNPTFMVISAHFSKPISKEKATKSVGRGKIAKWACNGWDSAITNNRLFFNSLTLLFFFFDAAEIVQMPFVGFFCSLDVLCWIINFAVNHLVEWRIKMKSFYEIGWK